MSLLFADSSITRNFAPGISVFVALSLIVGSGCSERKPANITEADSSNQPVLVREQSDGAVPPEVSSSPEVEGAAQLTKTAEPVVDVTLIDQIPSSALPGFQEAQRNKLETTVEEAPAIEAPVPETETYRWADIPEDRKGQEAMREDLRVQLISGRDELKQLKAQLIQNDPELNAMSQQNVLLEKKEQELIQESEQMKELMSQQKKLEEGASSEVMETAELQRQLQERVLLGQKRKALVESLLSEDPEISSLHKQRLALMEEINDRVEKDLPYAQRSLELKETQNKYLYLGRVLMGDPRYAQTP